MRPSIFQAMLIRLFPITDDYGWTICRNEPTLGIESDVKVINNVKFVDKIDLLNRFKMVTKLNNIGLADF